MVKLIVSDIDGTLVCEDGRLPGNFQQTIDRMRGKGIYFAVASGRPYTALYDMFGSSADDIIYIAENGAYTRYKDEVIHKQTLDAAIISRFASRFNCFDKKAFLAACGLKCYYIVDDVSELTNSLSPFGIKYSLTDSFDCLDDDIFQLTVFFPDGAKNITDSQLYNEFQNDFEFIITHTHWMDIYPKGVNKGVGLEAVYSRLCIKAAETVVFGDYYNDIPMFLKSGRGYCPETAPLAVRAYTDGVIPGGGGYAVTSAIMQIISG